jgi:SET domain-containing protein
MDSSVESLTTSQITDAPANVVVRQSAIHGTGAYARHDLAKGTMVIEYVGEKISKGESARRIDADNEYIFTLDDDHDLDGKVDWNPARFINHSCAPNCEAEIDGHRVFITALRDIQTGEELSFNYGYDLVDYREHPCRCGAPVCVGFMVAEEYFERVRRAHPRSASTYRVSAKHQRQHAGECPTSQSNVLCSEG